MKAIILAGGFGTRLQTVIKDKPKPMAPINEQPFLVHLMEHLSHFGVDHFILATHHLHDQIADYFSEGFKQHPVTCVCEATPLGTGGAILNALTQAKITEPVLVLNGDSLIKLDYQKLYQRHRQTQEQLTMVLRQVADTGRSGTVQLDWSGRIAQFAVRGKAGQAGLINAGCYVLSPAIFAGFSPGEAFSFEEDFLAPKVPALKPAAYLADQYFIDIGVPADYARAQDELEDALS